MTEKEVIRDRLWHSLEMHVVRRDLIMYLIAMGVFLLITGENPSVGIILACLGFGPFVVFHLWRTFQIFRRIEDYTFYKAKLTRFQQRFPLKTMYFTVVLEESDGSKQVVDTHAIFASHGVMEPLVESYVNSTVAIGLNRKTGMVVVIG